eukprot:symbB.v1.2.027495.t1/scaffold2824.1/size69421/2
MQLGIGVGRSTSPPPMAPLAADGPPKEAEMVLDATEAQEEPSSTVDVQKPQRESVKLPPAVVKIVGENIGLEDELGGHWEIYPDGLSQGFLKSMTYDYHSLTKRPGQPPPSTANVPTKVKRSRPRSTKTLEVGPLLTQRRAERREQQQQEESAAMIKAENIKAVAHLQHPLLEGLLPNVPMHVKPSPPAAPPGRPRHKVAMIARLRRRGGATTSDTSPELLPLEDQSPEREEANTQIIGQEMVPAAPVVPETQTVLEGRELGKGKGNAGGSLAGRRVLDRSEEARGGKPSREEAEERRPNFGCGSFTREECSWSDATSFYSRRCEKITDGGWRQM